MLGPDREVRNEPANLVVSAQMVAQIKDVTIEAVMRETTQNARRLFFGQQTQDMTSAARLLGPFSRGEKGPSRD